VFTKAYLLQDQSISRPSFAFLLTTVFIVLAKVYPLGKSAHIFQFLYTGRDVRSTLAFCTWLAARQIM